jgi:hypothetical protein
MNKENLCSEISVRSLAGAVQMIAVLDCDIFKKSDGQDYNATVPIL